MKKIKIKPMHYGCFLFASILNLFFGCVKYDNFNITEKPYLNKTSVILYVGDGAGNHNQIQLKSSPEGKQYTWTSLDPTVATVTQSGLITAVKEGFAVIAVASDNDQTNVSVWVRKWIPFEDFTLDKQQVEVKRLGKTQIIVNLIPQNASEVEISWKSSKPEIATVFDNGWIVGNEIGTAIITATIAGKEQHVEVQVVPELIKFARTRWTVPGYVAGNNNETIGYSSQHGGYSIMNLFDGNAGSFWHSRYSAPAANYPHWFIVDMHRSAIVAEIMLQRRQGFVSVNGFYLYSCPDVTVNQNDPVNGYPWEFLGEYQFNPSIDIEQRFIVPNRPNARYLKMYFDTKHKTPGAPNNFVQLAEFAVYGY